MSTLSHHQHGSKGEDNTKQFAMWALATLGIQVSTEDGHLYQFEVPESERDYFNGRGQVVFSASGEQPDTTFADVQKLTSQAEFIGQLAGRLQAEGRWVHAMPTHQPASVRSLTPKLFESFFVEKGTVRLAGCSLEDRPILRLTFRHSGMQAGSGKLVHTYIDLEGVVFTADRVQQLGLEELRPWDQKPPQLDDHQVSHFESLVRTKPPSNGVGWELLVATITWCKFATGKLALVVGEHSVDVPFSGWAKMLADGHTQPGPYRCPISGEQTYRVTAIDDGRIVNTLAVVQCDQSGQRTISDDLVTCPVTGRRALHSFFEVCPVSGERVLAVALAPCPVCQPRVNPQVIKGNACLACRSMRSVRKEDPRMARLLDEYPGLDHWRKWKLFESSRVYILQTAGLARSLLLVFDKESMEPYRVAMAGRFSSTWADVSDLQRDEILG